MLINTMNGEQIAGKLMTLEEVAEYLRLGVHTVYKMAQKGKIPALKASKQWRSKKEDVDNWPSSGKPQQGTEHGRKGWLRRFGSLLEALPKYRSEVIQGYETCFSTSKSSVNRPSFLVCEPQ